MRSFVYAENTTQQPTPPGSREDIPSELAEGQMGTENSLFTSTLQTPQLCGDLTEILLTAEKKKKKSTNQLFRTHAAGYPTTRSQSCSSLNEGRRFPAYSGLPEAPGHTPGNLGCWPLETDRFSAGRKRLASVLTTLGRAPGPVSAAGAASTAGGGPTAAPGTHLAEPQPAAGGRSRRSQRSSGAVGGKADL